MNPFEQFAEAQIASPVKARMRAAEKRQEALDRKADDNTKLLRECRWRQEQLDHALAGPHGGQIQALVDHLMSKSHRVDIDPDRLRAEFLPADPDTQFIARRLISDRVIELRENANLYPFDDEIPSFERAAV